jgi:hypothetical protein
MIIAANVKVNRLHGFTEGGYMQIILMERGS